MFPQLQPSIVDPALAGAQRGDPAPRPGWGVAAPQAPFPQAGIQQAPAQAGFQQYPPGWSPAPPPAKPSFFSEHKFAVIVSGILLCVIIVILYMYLSNKKDTRQQKGAKIKDEAGKPPDQNNRAKAEELEELKRIQQRARESRRALQPGRSGQANDAGQPGEPRKAPGARADDRRSESDKAGRAARPGEQGASVSDAGVQRTPRIATAAGPRPADSSGTDTEAEIYEQLKASLSAELPAPAS
ncbi:MAG: hypothetical protein KGL39_26615 [Patescibacteria group bacterium]|nr:hypothetical protein [Patescibacteria group bacterium]